MFFCKYDWEEDLILYDGFTETEVETITGIYETNYSHMQGTFFFKVFL